MRREEIRAVLLRHNWFGGLPKPLMEIVLDKSIQCEVAAGSLIYATGDEANGLFAVLSGEVRLVGNTPDGKSILYRRLRPGGWFGHLAVLDQQPRFQDAIAVMPTRLLHLTPSGFGAILDADPRYVVHFYHLVCRDIRIAMSMLAEMKASALPQRVAQVLLEMSSDGGGTEKPRMTQEAIAAMVGTSRQTVNRVLRRWVGKNVIEIEYGRVIVRNQGTLALIAGPKPVEV